MKKLVLPAALVLATSLALTGCSVLHFEPVPSQSEEGYPGLREALQSGLDAAKEAAERIARKTEVIIA